jgi:hypothetical protein
MEKVSLIKEAGNGINKPPPVLPLDAEIFLHPAMDAGGLILGAQCESIPTQYSFLDENSSY